MKEETRVYQEEARLMRAFGKACKDEWSKVKTMKRLVRFADKDSLRRVAEYGELLYRQVDLQDALKAIRYVAAMYDGAPWQIQDEAIREYNQRMDLEHQARKHEDRAWANKVKKEGGLMKHLRVE